MRMLLLGAAALAAVAIPAAPAAAQSSSTAGFAAGARSGQSSGTSSVRRGFGRDDGRDFRRDDRRDRDDRHRQRGDRVVFVPWYGSSDFDGNRGFDPDSFNDWWHERPWRSYPAWVARNGDCQRLWWSGGGWRC